MRATNTGSRVGVAGWPVRWRAAAMARWRTASGLRAGMPRPWRVKALRSDGQVVPSSVGGGVDAAELLGERVGAFGLGAVGEEAAGLPAHPPLRRRQAPLGEGGGEGVAVDAELAGGLPQPDLVGELVGGLGQLTLLPVGAGLGEGVAAQPAALGRQGAAEDAVIVVDAAGGLDREVQAVVADLAGGADGLGLGRLGLLAGLGEEPLGVVTAAGGLVQPGLPAVVLDHRDGSCGPFGLGGVTVGGAQRPQDLPHPALADPDQASHVG